MDQKKLVAELLQGNKLTVISTIGSDPASLESALISYIAQDDLSINFQTLNISRKYQNLREGRKVAFVFGFESEIKRSLQYEGTIETVTDQATIDQIKTTFIEKESLTSEAHLNNPDTRFFRVNPSWLRYSDYNASPPVIFELTDFS